MSRTVFGRVLRTGLSSLRDRAAARLAALRFNPSRVTITSTSTDEECAAIDAAFAKVDEAFREVDRAFGVMRK